MSTNICTTVGSVIMDKLRATVCGALSPGHDFHLQILLQVIIALMKVIGEVSLRIVLLLQGRTSLFFVTFKGLFTRAQLEMWIEVKLLRHICVVLRFLSFFTFRDQSKQNLCQIYQHSEDFHVCASHKLKRSSCSSFSAHKARRTENVLRI